MMFLIYLFLFSFGAVIGSFLNVCIYRIPRNISIVFPSSFCPKCGIKIPFYYNIPIIGYIILLGKCKFCKNKISLRYPFVEAITGFFLLISFINWNFPYNLIYFIFICTLIVITFIDIDFQIIPDRISLTGILLGYLVSLFIFKKGFLEPFLGIIVGGGIFYVIGVAYEFFTKREGLGGGDVKLMAMFGSFLGLKSIPFIILISSFTGTIVGLYLIFYKNKDSKYAIPFGPFLCLGALVYIFAGEKIINWYLGKLM